MKFSDWVVMGSTIVEFDSTVFLAAQCGCFIGMAFAAKTGISDFSQLDKGEFPWLWLVKQHTCPVCNTVWHNACAAISCVAAHVEMKEWTFTDALEYIRSIEPGETTSEHAETVETVLA